jgi:DNA-binding LacI/PurR family transcriptional regulator
MSKICIDDIARICNVSKATVSRVLNHPEMVAVDLREHIFRVIDETGYSPNQFAQRLGRSEEHWGTALFVYDIVNPFFSLITRGLTTLSLQNNIPMFVFETLNSLERERLYLDLLIKNKVSGVVFTAGVSEESIRRANDYFPVVVIDQHFEHLQIPEVLSDNLKGAKQAVDYLIKLNHRRIAFINGPEGWISSQTRFEGYLAALREADIPFDPRLVFRGNLQLYSGLDAGKYFMSLDEWPTAIFAANDQMALGAMNNAQMMNLHIPGDLSIIGFDGTSVVTQARPQLTTVQQDIGQICNTAMSLLSDLIQGKDVEKDHLIDTTLVIGDTCRRLSD